MYYKFIHYDFGALHMLEYIYTKFLTAFPFSHVHMHIVIIIAHVLGVGVSIFNLVPIAIVPLADLWSGAFKIALKW